MLVSGGIDGTYLVRASESKSDSMVLSVGFQKRVHHYRIVHNHGTFRMETHKETVFNSLPELVQHFNVNDKLATKLTTPILNQSEDDGPAEEYDETVSMTDTVLQALTRRGSASVKADNAKDIADYVKNHLMNDSEVIKTDPNKTEFNKMMMAASKDLSRELQIFYKRMNVIRDMFATAGKAIGMSVSVPELDTMSDKIEDVDDLICQLGIASTAARDAQSQGHRFLRVAPSGAEMDNDEVSFVNAAVQQGFVYDVKRIETIKKVAGFIRIDIESGEVTIGDGKHGVRPGIEYTYKEIIQLIKSRSDKSKLGIVIKTGKGKPERKNFAFENGREREQFSQNWQAMKIKHGDLDDAVDRYQKLLVFCGTFNMGEEAAPPNLKQWFDCQGDGKQGEERVEYDIYAIGTQEQKGSDSEFYESVLKHIGDKYEMLTKVSLQQIRLAIFVKKVLITTISHIQTSSVATGVQTGITTLGNKGAVAVAMFVNNTSFCFLNCHLAAGAEKWSRRNANYRDILAKMQLGDKKKLNDFDVTNQFHHVFLFGDLNYRIQMDCNEALNAIAGGNYDVLLKNDQLTLHRKSHTVLYGFEEGAISFKPTYRYARGEAQRFVKNKYDSYKIKSNGAKKTNVPSWCDRVLHRCFPNQGAKQLVYGCTTNVVTSDHSPVYAGYELSIANQFVSRNTVAQHDCQIIISDLHIKIITNIKTGFYVELYGAFFATTVKTQQTDNISVMAVEGLYDGGMMGQHWEEQMSIFPFMPDRKYLESEVILVAVKSLETNEVFGTGRFPLVGSGSESSSNFKCELMYQGSLTGYLKGKAKILNAVGKGFDMLKEENDDGVDGNTGLGHRTRAFHTDFSKKKSTKVKTSTIVQPVLMDFLVNHKLEHLHEVLSENGYDAIEFLGDTDESDFKGLMSGDDVVALMHAISIGFREAE